MPSTSPGSGFPATPLPTATPFTQILPGALTPSLESFATFVFRFKRYIAYISGSQLNILSSPTSLLQAIHFKSGLVAIAADAAGGKLVVADQCDVWVLEPISEGWTKIRWEKTLNLRRKDATDAAQTLSWGNEGEVLVGGHVTMSLFSTLASSRSSSLQHYLDGENAAEFRTALWEKSVASPVFQAAFSPTSSMIATRACYDRLVKIWRRLSFEEGLFDHTYLQHPQPVTHIQWRPLSVIDEERRGSGISGRHDDEAEVLYTIASDGILRVWRAGGMHDLDILTLHTTIDLVGAIPQSPSMTATGSGQSDTPPRYTIIVPADQFRAALHAAIGLPQEGKVSHSRELLKEMISQEPDVVLAFDGQGRMSAWGLQSIIPQQRSDTLTQAQWFHISHSENLHLRFPSNAPAMCGAWFQNDKLHVLTHILHQDGKLTWWTGDVETFFSLTASGRARLSPATTWTGHQSGILNLHPHSKGLLSWSSDTVNLWDADSADDLTCRGSFNTGLEILAVATLESVDLVLTVVASEIAAWDQHGTKIGQATCDISSTGRIHVNQTKQTSVSGVFVTDDGANIMTWALEMLDLASASRQAVVNISTKILNLRTHMEDAVFALPVSMPFNPGQSCLVVASSTGRLACNLGTDNTDLGQIAVFETGVIAPTLFAATEEFAALVSQDGKELVVVDLTDGYLEHRQALTSPATHLEAFSPKARHNFLAVGRDDTIDLLVQGRYEHHSANLPVWVTVKSVSIANTGLRISALAWMPIGNLVVAAGNSIFIASADVELLHLDVETREANDLVSETHLAKLAVQLTSPLPAWHPSLLSHLIHHGHFGLVSTILAKLSQQLKFWGNGEELHPMLDEPIDLMSQQPDSFQTWLSDDAVHDLKEQLHEKDLPALSRAEQRRLLHVVEATSYLRGHVKALDKHAQRYLFAWKLQLLYSSDRHSVDAAAANGEESHNQFVPEMLWREVAFASQSTTQQALLDILLLHYDNKLTWPIARRLGLTSWLSDREALEHVFEQMAQSAYRSESPPDPVNASLYFLALKKKPTLLALWRIATWHKEQRTTSNFLKRDFAQPDAKTAAKKNAYALMGKRRFYYSAAFFLLADDPSSAVSVLAGQCEDARFAIAVARLYCGDGSDVLRKLLEERVMPKARSEGNRWLMSWCHSILLEKSSAANILVEPLDSAMPKTWQQDDPSTLLLYRALRGGVPAETEYGAVLRAARILRRMGLWLLALDLVSGWKFLAVQPRQNMMSANDAREAITNDVNGLSISEPQTLKAKSPEPPSLLDNFTAEPPPTKAEPRSLLDTFTPSESAKPVVEDEKSAREAKAAEMLKKLKAKKAASVSVNGESGQKKPEPTQFKEPDATSLLDSFGF